MQAKRPNPCPSAMRLRHSGFTMIELMVGLGLGMLTVAIIAQVMALSEGQKRTTTNGSDAQISGALSLYAIQHEVQMAGYGITGNPAAMGCTVKYKVAGTSGNFTLAPIIITDGGSASDTITVLRSAKVTFSTPIKITADHTQSDNEFTVASSVGAIRGDLMVAVPGDISTSTCSMTQVTDEAATKSITSHTIPHYSVPAAPWNTSSPADVFPAIGYPRDTSYLVNLGSMLMTQYSVNSNTYSLQSRSMTATTQGWSTATDVQPQVVVMKALYGKDTTGDGAIDSYDKVTPTTNAQWQQIKSMRLLIVARSSQYEKEAVSSDAIDNSGLLQWDVGSSAVPVAGAASCASNPNSQCLPISMTFLGATDWKHYRYKVYDTVIPLRNLLWNS